ncbi:hypothetical protein [Pseudonocardia hierapolitana]|uniref:hypothetical protein n=1 Tax=Pseudonocardia hierapolitana TaxID=1128676 RepID=UPI0011BF8755|nr:hypothetical protein [Pseudonocardia hierapolitana]
MSAEPLIPLLAQGVPARRQTRVLSSYAKGRQAWPTGIDPQLLGHAAMSAGVTSWRTRHLSHAAHIDWAEGASLITVSEAGR